MTRLDKELKWFRKRKNRAVCPSGQVKFIAECECRHSFLQFKTCKKENCPVCGQENSSLHSQRFARWIGKIMWILEKEGIIGYMVITLPREYWQKDREFLKEFRRYVVLKLKRMGYKYGKVRFHWAGDRNRCFYPHLNILMGAGYIEKEKIQKLKREIGKWLGFDNQVVVEYHYSRNKGKIIHWIKYITRPTLLLIREESERSLVWESVVKGYKNDVEWGKPGEIEWEKVNLEDVRGFLSSGDYKLYCLYNNVCPFCGRQLKWRLVRNRDSPFRDVIYGNFYDNSYVELIR